jgi:MFS transporter, DHA1 family, arabinose polymer utilization protein
VLLLNDKYLTPVQREVFHIVHFMKKSLFPLLLGGLGIGTTEFVVMGLLPDIAADLSITIPEAGHIISAYALGVVVGAPLLVVLSGSQPPKKILLLLMILFTAFNALSAFAPNYAILMFTRFLAGLPHGAFFGVGAVVASRIADKGKQAQAIAVMFAGLTLANLAMVPLGTWVGHHFSWRYTIGIVAFIGIVTVLFLKIWIPALPVIGEGDGNSKLQIFRNRQVWLVILITAIGTGGLFTWISYIAPLMTEISHFTPDNVSWIMILAGLGMVAGNFVGGKMADSFDAAKTCGWLLMAMVVTLISIHLFSFNQAASLVLTFIAGALSIALAAPIQILMINTARESEMLGAALIQGAFNIGNSLGAFLGGLPIVAGFGYNTPVLVGALMASTGIVFVMILVRMRSAAVSQSAVEVSG